MTKPRAPLTFENALARIAGQIGWAAMAEAASAGLRTVKERTVRNWGDPDTPERCAIEDAMLLDIAYQTGGGLGAPMFETYSLMLDQVRTERFSDQAELGKRTIAAVRENSEAEAALIAASLPGANPADYANALREVEEAVAALKQTLPLLTNGTGANGTTGEGTAPGGAKG
ncbi:MAG: hypothetical protein V4475_01805 [Pseudomonadota bacterium]